jgi:hypothetical protein
VTPNIDVRSALQEGVRADYADLVTRHTGQLVRRLVEQRIAALADGTVAVLDFSHIGVIDRSCADEFLAKLMLPLTAEHPAHDGYVVLRGISDDHLEIIEAVLAVHDLALVVQLPSAELRLVGAVSEQERRCWELVMRHGSSLVDAVADATGLACDACQEMLERLARRRLLRREADRFVPLGAVA